MRVFLLLALSACTAGKDTSDDTSGENAGENGGNAGENGGGDNGCAQLFSPVGTTLTHGYTSSDVEGSYTITLVSLDASSGDALFNSDAETITGNATSVSNTVQYGTCAADGFYLSSQVTNYSVTSGGNQFTGTVTTTYDPVAFIIPATISAGSTWTTEFNGSTTDSTSGNTTPISSTQTASVAAAESVTVPAGTFTAFPITYSTSGQPESHAWITLGVGTVQTDSSELLSVE